MNLRRWLIFALTCSCFACSPGKELPPEIMEPTATSHTLTTTASATLYPSQTPSLTQPPAASLTPTPIEYSILRGKVVVNGRLSCRFGPGAMYLYKFSFASGTSIELVGRMEYSHWVLVRAIGGTNRCWVNGGAQFLEIDGDAVSLRPVDPHIVLAWSPYYGAMGGIGAAREGNVVTVRWGGIQLRAGDDSEQTPYVVEAWVCQGGEFVFAPVGSYGFSAEIIDEPGCAERSHARVAAAEKHGYTPWVEVDWPALGN
jgi:hypothetical protein